ncbi:hypothetical protein Ddc_23903 [Ditylenchus destructor]|nr:hypothetical protein Ddc_23903 [Ditylenchus destructor]
MADDLPNIGADSRPHSIQNLSPSIPFNVLNNSSDDNNRGPTIQHETMQQISHHPVERLVTAHSSDLYQYNPNILAAHSNYSLPNAHCYPPVYCTNNGETTVMYYQTNTVPASNHVHKNHPLMANFNATDQAMSNNSSADNKDTCKECRYWAIDEAAKVFYENNPGLERKRVIRTEQNSVPKRARNLSQERNNSLPVIIPTIVVSDISSDNEEPHQDTAEVTQQNISHSNQSDRQSLPVEFSTNSLNNSDEISANLSNAGEWFSAIKSVMVANRNELYKEAVSEIFSDSDEITDDIVLLSINDTEQDPGPSNRPNVYEKKSSLNEDDSSNNSVELLDRLINISRDASPFTVARNKLAEELFDMFLKNINYQFNYPDFLVLDDQVKQALEVGKQITAQKKETLESGLQFVLDQMSPVISAPVKKIQQHFSNALNELDNLEVGKQITEENKKALKGHIKYVMDKIKQSDINPEPSAIAKKILQLKQFS